METSNRRVVSWCGFYMLVPFKLAGNLAMLWSGSEIISLYLGSIHLYLFPEAGIT